MGVGARCLAAPSPQRQRSEGTKISSTFRPHFRPLFRLKKSVFQAGFVWRVCKKSCLAGLKKIEPSLSGGFEKKQNPSVCVDFKSGVYLLCPRPLLLAKVEGID